MWPQIYLNLWKMLSCDKILKETSPFSIFFVKSGSSGNRLLFRFPYDENFQRDPDLVKIFEDGPASEQDRLQLLSVIQENDEALCNMFSVNPNLCGQKFEIKINSVRHVGHPMSLLSTNLTPCCQPNMSTANGPLNVSMPALHATCRSPTTQSLPACNGTLNHLPPSPGCVLSNQPQRMPAHHNQVNLSLASYDCLTAPNRNHNINQGDITSFNIVCALRSSASYDIVDCYHDLSKRLAIALSFEERRCSYLSKEIKTIMTTLEERDMAYLAERDQERDKISSNTANEAGNGKTIGISDGTNGPGEDKTKESVFSLILNRSHLARDLRRTFISLCTTGIVDLKINNWVSVSFCLPQKVHRLKLMNHKSMPAVSTKDIKRCLLYLRPYHGLLLLQEPQELLDSLPIDASPAFIQLIRVTKPDKNLMDLSVDANLTLMQIFSIVSQLIYWAKATVIYPICDSNIYAIHPLASTGLRSKLVQDFRIRFPNSKSIHHYLADFSEGTSLSQLNGPLLNIEEKLNLLNIVTWLLQRRILTQIHKYIFLVVEREQQSGAQIQSQEEQPQQQPPISQPSPNNKRQVGKLANHLQPTYVQNETNNSNPSGVGVNMSSDGRHINNSSNLVANNNNNINSNNPNNSGNSSGNFFREGNAGPNARIDRLGTSSNLGNSFESSPHLFKNSYSESLESSMRRYRTDSLAESQEDSNFCLNSSLSSTPNSNLDYPSPGHDAKLMRSSLSSSCPLDNPLNTFGGTNSILATLQRAGLNQLGSRSVLAIPSSRQPEDLKLLLRLIPYFDGKHHVEDIMFFENLERSQVLILCDKFRDILFTCHYEDVAVSQLCPFSSTNR